MTGNFHRKNCFNKGCFSRGGWMCCPSLTERCCTLTCSQGVGAGCIHLAPERTGTIGPTGPAGPTAATIPFSVGENGIQLATYASGNPQIVSFAGFGPGHYYPIYIQEGEWQSGVINIGESSYNGSSFIMPRDAVLKNIYLLFSTKSCPCFEEGVIIRPFVCLAVSSSNDLAFRIIQETMTFTEPYVGLTMSKHSVKRGSKTGLNVPIPEGMLTAIVLGMKAENLNGNEVSGSFTVSGGLYFE